MSEKISPAQFPLTGQHAPMVVHVALTGSTQDDLAELWETGSAPAGTVMIADDQWAGRGRVGRSWYSHAGHSLLASVLLELPESVADHMQWVTLSGALAALESVRIHASSDAPERVALSWPNDVVVLTDSEPRKLGGLLGEVCGRRDSTIACILGWGLNLSLPQDELPTPTSASLLTAGLRVAERDPLIATYLQGLHARLNSLIEHGDAEKAGLLEEMNRVTETLRPGITVGRPRLSPLNGEGLRVLPDASLEMRTQEGIQIVTSGEVSLLGSRPSRKEEQ